MAIKLNKRMREAAALCGLPPEMWAYRTLNQGAADVFGIAHAALSGAGLRDDRMIEQRERARLDARAHAESMRKLDEMEAAAHARAVEACSDGLPTRLGPPGTLRFRKCGQAGCSFCDYSGE